MRRLMLAVTLLLLPVSVCHARPISPVQGLEALRTALAGITDFTAELSQEKRLSLMKRTMSMTGTVRFRKPDMFRLEILAPYASRMVLRDATIEQATGGTGERNRIVLPPEQGLRRWFSRMSGPVTSLPEGMAVQADLTGTTYTVTITPQGKGQLKELVIAFQEDGVIKRLAITERSGDRAVMTFRGFRRNVGLTEKDFTLD